MRNQPTLPSAAPPPGSGTPRNPTFTSSSSRDVQHAHICQKLFKKKKESFYTFYPANFPRGTVGSKRDRERENSVTISHLVPGCYQLADGAGLGAGDPSRGEAGKPRAVCAPSWLGVPVSLSGQDEGNRTPWATRLSTVVFPAPSPQTLGEPTPLFLPGFKVPPCWGGFSGCWRRCWIPAALHDSLPLGRVAVYTGHRTPAFLTVRGSGSGPGTVSSRSPASRGGSEPTPACRGPGRARRRPKAQATGTPHAPGSPIPPFLTGHLGG